MTARACILLLPIFFTLTIAPLSGPDALSGANRRIVRLAEIEFDELPGVAEADPQKGALRPPFDRDSIELYVIESDTSYHPVYLLHRTEDFISLYYKTGEPAWRDRATRYMDKLLSLAHRQQDALFLPYSFAFKVHGSSEYLLPAPWYSGMAQGVALRTACRLFIVTGDSTWLHAADSAFNSLLHTDTETGLTVARIDGAGFYWIEEYPITGAPGMTLNGFVAAVQGVYEYYLLSRTPRAKTLLECTITTLERYLPEFRQPGERSLYCLGHRRTADEKYHGLHIRQMYQLEQMTGNPFFRRMAEQFTADIAD